MSDTNIQEAVKQKYGEAAKRAVAGGTACCGGGAQLSGCDPITRDLYSDAEKGALPEKAVAASLGCGNPTALAELQPGEIVLDLGSGGGIDVILSAKRVGPAGKAYGLDMTDEMLALARENQKKAGIDNVELRHQSFRRQGSCPRRSLSRSQTGRTICRFRRGRSRRRSSKHSQEHGTLGRLHLGSPRGKRISRKAGPRRFRIHRRRSYSRLQGRRGP